MKFMNFPMEIKIVGLVKNSKEDGYIYGEDKNYIIPEYQREYSWGETQIESFITSLKRAIDGESVFMGTVQFAYCCHNSIKIFPCYTTGKLIKTSCQRIFNC